MYPLTRQWRFGGPKAKRSQPEEQSKPKKRERGSSGKPKNTRRCERCGQMAFIAVDDDTLKAHQWQTNGQWCRGGQAPSDGQRKAAAKAKKKRSVHASSGGLPTLGGR